MSILIIGGDNISHISSMLMGLGAKDINHWDARKKSSAQKKKEWEENEKYRLAELERRRNLALGANPEMAIPKPKTKKFTEE